MSNDARSYSHYEKSLRDSHRARKPDQPRLNISGLKWVIGTPYFVQGTIWKSHQDLA
jgi:hypothetical protein